MRKSSVRNYSNPRVLAFVKKYGGRLQNPEKIIIHLARSITKRAHSFTTPPFSPEIIAKECAIEKIIEKEFMLVDASLVDEGGHYLIYTASGISRGRRNFSVFHEIAHTFFIEASKEYKPFLSADERKILSRTYQEEERLCNIAATEFLLPAQSFQTNMANMDLTWQSISNLATKFEASLEATARRVGEFYKGSFMMVRWRFKDDDLQPLILSYSQDMTRFSDRVKGNLAPPVVFDAFNSGEHLVDSTTFFLKGGYVPFTLELKCIGGKGGAQEVLGLYSSKHPGSLGAPKP